MKFLVCMKEECVYLVKADNANQAIKKVFKYCGYGENPILEKTEKILELAEYVELANKHMSVDKIVNVMQTEMVILYGNNHPNNVFFVIE